MLVHTFGLGLDGVDMADVANAIQAGSDEDAVKVAADELEGGADLAELVLDLLASGEPVASLDEIIGVGHHFADALVDDADLLV